MPISRKVIKAREPYTCEFCKDEIKRGEKHVRTYVRDRFGHYTVRRHQHCEHTAALNRVADRVFG